MKTAVAVFLQYAERRGLGRTKPFRDDSEKAGTYCEEEGCAGATVEKPARMNRTEEDL